MQYTPSYLAPSRLHLLEFTVLGTLFQTLYHPIPSPTLLTVILQLVLYGNRWLLKFIVDTKLLVLVLPRNVPSHRVVPRERPRAVRTVHPDALVPLPDVRSQVRLVAVQPLTEWTL